MLAISLILSSISFPSHDFPFTNKTALSHLYSVYEGADTYRLSFQGSWASCFQLSSAKGKQQWETGGGRKAKAGVFLPFSLWVCVVPLKAHMDGSSWDSNPGHLTPEPMLSTNMLYCLLLVGGSWGPQVSCSHFQLRYCNFCLQIHVLHRLQAPGVISSIYSLYLTLQNCSVNMCWVNSKIK